MARKLGLIALSVVVLIAAVAVGAVGWLVWFPDTLKPPLERLLTAQLGQQVRIDGPLRVEPGRVTAVEVNGLHIAAPEWARADEIVDIARLRVAADLWSYLRHGTMRIMEFAADSPHVALERDAQSRTSWPNGGGPGKGGAMPKLSVGTVAISDGRFEFIDAPSQVELAANMATEATPGTAVGLKLDGSGKVRGDPLQFGLHVGEVQQLAQGGAPMPIDGSLTLAATRVELKGVIKEPAALAGIDLGLNVASDDPSGLLALAGRQVNGPAPPLALSARLTGGGKAYAVDDLRARWGESALDGSLRADLGAAKPRLDGTLGAQRLDLATMLPLLTSSDQSPGSPVASSNPLTPLAGYEGRLELAATEIDLPSKLVLRDTAATLELADEKLRVAPLRVGLPEGAVEGELATGPLDAPELTVDTRLAANGVGVAGLAGPGYDGKVNGRLDGMLAAGSTQAMLARSRLRFQGSGESLGVPQAKLGSLQITAMLENGRLRLDPLQAHLPQGAIAGSVVAGPFDENFAADLDLEAAGVDLGAAARTDGVAGRLDSHLTGTLHGAQPLDILTRSRVELVGTIDGLQLPQIERRVSEAKLQVTLDPDRREALKIEVKARAGDRPLALTAFGGSFGTLAENQGDYPFTVTSELGKNQIDVNGTVSLPLAKRKFSATVRAQGPDPSPILALFGLPKLQFPPYRLSGTLTNIGDELRVKDFVGHVGDTDVTANLTASYAGERPKLAGTMHSKVLDADDLGGLVGATPATGPGETASPGEKAEARQIEAKTDVLPNEPIEPARWRKVDFDLDLRADKVRAGKIPLDGFSGKLTVDDGLLRLDRLDLRVGEGHIKGRIEADGRQAPVRSNVDLNLQRLSMARLLNRLDIDVGALGILSGQARGGVGLGGRGFSIKDMLAHSNGDVQLLMEGGQIDRTIVAGLGLDLFRLFGAVVGAAPKTVELRCALADLKIGDGIVRTDPLVVDTTIADLGGRGTINLKNEAIDISLTARPKDSPLLTDLTGISIGGKLGAPELNINPLAVAARGVTAATLGVLLKPFTSLAGAVDQESPSACATLLRQPVPAKGG
jgi:uncharacterized protein involved in outer membrane biogenesis